MSTEIYCLDTCSLTWAMRDAFAPDITPTFWEKLSEAAKAGRLVSTEMVFREIEKQDDDLHEWCKKVPELFREMDQLTLNKTAEIISIHGKMIDPYKDKDGADPFLIAQASILNAVVVTQEHGSGNPEDKLKIPDVCARLGIRCINMLTMVRELAWKFR